MMTYKQARDLHAEYGQALRDLCNTRRGELQATWRDEMQCRGVLDPGKPPATRDELVQQIISYRYPITQINEWNHVLYHAPSSRWPACKHCATETLTARVHTGQLQVGDVVRNHGMRVRIDAVNEYSPTASGAERAWSCPGTVLNAAEVLEQRVIPRSFLQRHGYIEGEGWTLTRDDAWTVQGNTLAMWTVELPRPAAPRPVPDAYHSSDGGFRYPVNHEPDRRPHR